MGKRAKKNPLKRICSLNILLANPFGKVAPPPGVRDFPGAGSLTGLPAFITVILRTLILGAALYALLNFVLAGYDYISSGTDPKKISDAWARIWQSLVGLLIAAGSIVLAALVGWLIFKDPSALLQVKVFGP